jgi:hypothetical protein
MGGHYTNTSAIAYEIRQMVMFRFQMAMASCDHELNAEIQEFLSEFDAGFKGLENLNLVKPANQ